MQEILDFFCSDDAELPSLMIHFCIPTGLAKLLCFVSGLLLIIKFLSDFSSAACNYQVYYIYFLLLF